jgi:hypothetical protein
VNGPLFPHFFSHEPEINRAPGTFFFTIGQLMRLLFQNLETDKTKMPLFFLIFHFLAFKIEKKYLSKQNNKGIELHMLFSSFFETIDTLAFFY